MKLSQKISNKETYLEQEYFNFNLPRPIPSAGLEAYHHERQLCLAGDPRKRENYDRYLSSSRRKEDINYLPVKLDIENVSRCNFRCTMCLVSDWENGRRTRDMNFDEFTKLIDEAYGLVEVKIQGLGEPLMQGDDFFKMISYARARHIWVRSSTNGSLLYLNNNYKKLIDNGINELQISLDGATADVFESIRRGSKFANVVKNCELINQYCRVKNVRVTKAWALVQKKNAHQLTDIINLASKLGFQDLVFSFSIENWGLEDWQITNNKVETNVQQDRDLIKGLISHADNLSMRLGFWITEKKYSSSSKETLCPWPFERALVSSDLKTVPCCIITTPDVFEFEVGSGKSFVNIWQGEAYRKFRQAHINGEIPEVCRWCYDD